MTGGAVLDAADIGPVLEAVVAIGGIRTLDTFGPQALSVLRQAVSFDLGSFNEVDQASGKVSYCALPAGTPPGIDVEAFPRLLPQNPILQHQRATGEGSARRLSDFLTQDQLHELDLYRQIYGPLGVEFQVAFALATKEPLVIAFALSRTRTDFTPREVALLEVLRPHLIQAYRNAQALSALERIEGTLAESGKAVVVLGHVGLDPHASPWAVQALTAHFGPGTDGGLPPRVAEWLAEERTRLFTDGQVRIQRPLVNESDGRQLVVRYVPGASPRPDVLVIDERAPEREAAELQRLGLTPREAELLRLLVRGHSSVEASASLGMAEATANKHLQHIYRKLGVNGRAAAVAAAADAIFSAV